MELWEGFVWGLFGGVVAELLGWFKLRHLTRNEMPQFYANRYYWGVTVAMVLVGGIGPLIQVEIGLPAALEEFCVSKNIQIPTPIAGYALIDTGATSTAVHEQCLLRLGLAGS